ncbi:lanthionine synthetase LanC family protein [Streptomyces sp. NPDC001165]|uniref:lanthionine synthetase LanC family protein n=1 Tax=Streptomyces sp. NPDC001165 TaxID=3364546 RepID=UPI0036A8B5E5
MADTLAKQNTSGRALSLARQVSVRWPNPDVCHEAAGAGLAQLHIWQATGDTEFRARVIEAGEGLVAAAEPVRSGVIWPVPADFDSELAGVKHLGFAHGVAGIGTFLLLSGLATDREDFLDFARWAGDTLATTARIEGGAAWWPQQYESGSERFQLPYWCSGASGIGTFLLRLWQATKDSRYLELAERAAAEVYRWRWRCRPRCATVWRATRSSCWTWPPC